MMLKGRVTTALLGAFVLAGTSYADQSAAPNYSKAEVHMMVREAHTADQYRALASYFRAQQSKFQAQAQSEKQEWERRSQNVAGPSAKYPRPVDSSKNRYDYFTYEAGQMGKQAAHYESLSAEPQLAERK